MVAFNTWGGEPRSDRPNGGFYVEENAETSKTLDSQGGLNPSASQGGTVVASPVAFNSYQRTEQDVTWPLGASDGRKVEVGVRSAMSVRRLTPRECERLQGFPGDYTAITYRNKPAADGPRYKALGNSMAVPCMWWIGMRIAKATEQE